MTAVLVSTGILKGLSLEEATPAELQAKAEPAHLTELTNISFYKKELGRAVYRGVNFSNCGFAKSTLDHVSFYKCKFTKVDFTRTKFVNCFFFECTFQDCDPYHVSFENTEINPASFKKCYRFTSDWNKALILFSELRRSLLESGDGRLSRVADYYFRSWQRRRLHHLWKNKQLSGFLPWFWSVCLWLITGYGERPGYLLLWALGLISALGAVYKFWFPSVLQNVSNPIYRDFWYLSFQIFFGKGLSATAQSAGLLTVEVSEFACGLVLIALLIASATRKLSP
jgi:hypothetical protein